MALGHWTGWTSTLPVPKHCVVYSTAPFQSYSIVKSRQPALFVQEPGIGEEEMAAFLLPPQEEKGGVEEEEGEEDLLDQL